MEKKNKVQGELIYGVNPLLEVLKAKRRKVISIYTTRPTPKAWSQIEKLLPARPIPIQYVARDVLTNMAKTGDHQGIVAWVQHFPFRSKAFDPLKHKFLVLLDGIQDPRNVGAIIRSAYCTGADGVILVQKFGAPLTATALKSAAGLAEHLEIMVAPTTPAAIQNLKTAGYTIYLAAFGAKDATTLQFQTPLCMVIGSEGEGIMPSVLKAGIPVTLPQKTADISYNASVAAGILLFLIGTQQKKIT
jgi:23S rRNA (guanosine2251-2'-O)-methyltransferase